MEKIAKLKLSLRKNFKFVGCQINFLNRYNFGLTTVRFLYLDPKTASNKTSFLYELNLTNRDTYLHIFLLVLLLSFYNDIIILKFYINEFCIKIIL